MSGLLLVYLVGLCFKLCLFHTSQGFVIKIVFFCYVLSKISQCKVVSILQKMGCLKEKKSYYFVTFFHFVL